jgi:hypothetical protein
MAIAQVVVFLLGAAIFCAFPAALLFVSGPPEHGSWWYPNPDRWDYGFKLLLYAALDANTPRQPGARWFVRVTALLVLAGILACLGGAIFWPQR